MCLSVSVLIADPFDVQSLNSVQGDRSKVKVTMLKNVVFVDSDSVTCVFSLCHNIVCHLKSHCDITMPHAIWHIMTSWCDVMVWRHTMLCTRCLRDSWERILTSRARHGRAANTQMFSFKVYSPLFCDIKHHDNSVCSFININKLSIQTHLCIFILHKCKVALRKIGLDDSQLKTQFLGAWSYYLLKQWTLGPTHL